MSLSGRSMPVMEDSPVPAADLVLLLEDVGTRVIGPYCSVAYGLGRIDGAMPEAALLDVELLVGKLSPWPNGSVRTACPASSTRPKARAATRSRRRPARRCSENPFPAWPRSIC